MAVASPRLPCARAWACGGRRRGAPAAPRGAGCVYRNADLGQIGRNGGRDLDLVGEPVAVALAASREMPRRGERARAGQERQALGDEDEAHAARMRHLVAVPEEAEAGDVGAGVDLEASEHARGRGVERRHALDRGRVLGRAPRAALERRRDDPRAEGLGEDERVAGSGPDVAQDAVGVHESGHRHTVLDLLVDDGVAAEHHHACLLGLGEAAAQDVGEDLEGDVLREARHVERRLRLAPHGVDVGERVGGRDRAELEGVVDDRREEVDGLHERQVGRDTEHPGVVGGRGADQQIRVHHRRERAEDLRQVRRTQLAGSTRRARPRRQPEELRPRARAALAFGHEGHASDGVATCPG